MTKSDFEQDGSEDEFFWWMRERQQIYLYRQAGLPPPWTSDPILRDYFFTNVYREQDKVTVWVREHWRERKAPAHLMIFNMAVARFFNWIPTLETIGWTQDWHSKRVERDNLLHHQNEEKHIKIFNDAYIIAGTDLKGYTKISGVMRRLDILWEERRSIADAIRPPRTSLEFAWHALQVTPGIGPFIAYEIVTDLRHTPVLHDAPDICTWANPGPGAIRGLQRIYGKEAVRGKEAAIVLMHTLMEACPMPVEMRDIEHSLCEYDKYKRIKLGQGIVRRYRYVA